MKNILNKLKSLFVILLLFPCLMVFSACGKNGLSAYEIAKQNGFSGTEQEWLDSLKGKDGIDGTDATTPSYYNIYKEARDEGEFSGTYTEFLKQVLSGESVDNSAVINKALSSVVSIKTYNNADSPKNGSGVIYSLNSNGDAIIITNYHVVYNSSSLPNQVFKNIKVSLFGEISNYTTNASFIGGSRDYDIAVLKVVDCDFFKDAKASAIKINPVSPKIGTNVIAIGNSKGYGISTTTGIISRNNDSVKMTIAGAEKKYRLLRHSAMITGGNSGGGLFNTQGELIGITNGGDSSDKFINYAIPASAVYSITENILANCNGTSIIKAQEFNHGLSFYSTNTTLEFDHDNGETVIIDEVSINQNQSEISNFQTISHNDILSNIKITKTSISQKNPEVIEKTITRVFEVKEFILLANTGDEITFFLNNAGTSYQVTVTLQTEYFVTIN